MRIGFITQNINIKKILGTKGPVSKILKQAAILS
jgi:hypothetical protein